MEGNMYISEVMTTVPEDKRGELETKVYEELTRLNIKFERVDNDSVETMEECVEISNKLGAEIRKTIICCNRQKTDYYLVVLPADKRFDSKLFASMMRTARVSFASAEDMESLIGLTPGEASVMGILNDPECRIQVVIDKAVADDEWFACNPGANTTHIRIKTKQLLNTFLPAEKHKPEIIML
jgi:Ala-tRNA(Pro) deacylase